MGPGGAGGGGTPSKGFMGTRPVGMVLGFFFFVLNRVLNFFFFSLFLKQGIFFWQLSGFGLSVLNRVSKSGLGRISPPKDFSKNHKP